tara:strand:- start:361 stop:657 length:297 start_codon:yes stop_codon:yes gene_type:complete
MMWFWWFLLSLFLNIVMLFYIRWLLNIIKVINQDISNLSEMITDFSQHIGNIYELEMFYGDETLQALLNHAKQLVDTLQDLDLVLNEEEENETNEKEK